MHVYVYKSCDLPARVGPRAKLEVALLVVEGEPGDVNLARRLEDARRYEETVALIPHHNVRLVRPVKLLISAGIDKKLITMSNAHFGMTEQPVV